MTRDSRRLGIGLVGSGFNAGFHLQAFRAVRDADVRGVWSPNPANASRAAARARALDVGDARPFASLGEMAADPVDRRPLAHGPQSSARRECRGNRGRPRARPREPARDRLRKAAGAHRRGGRAHRGTGPAGGACARLPGEPGLRPAGGGGARACLEARRARERTAVPRPCGRGARRPARTLVLARRPAGRRRAQRHDVPFGAARAPSPDRAGRGPRFAPDRARHGKHREPQMVTAGIRPGAPPHARRRDRLRETTVGGFREPDDRVRDRRGPDRDRRGDGVLELRRRGAAALGGAARPGVLDVLEHARQRAQALLFARRGSDGRRGPGREAERGDRPHAGRRQRACAPTATRTRTVTSCARFSGRNRHGSTSTTASRWCGC